MKKKGLLPIAIVVALMFVVAARGEASASTEKDTRMNRRRQGPDIKPQPRETINISTLRVPFVENAGQISGGDVRYYADVPGGAVFVAKDGALVYRLSTAGERAGADGWVIRERFMGATPRLKGEEKTATHVNYFIGKDPREWKTGLSSYGVVSLGEIYRGVELKLKIDGNSVEKVFTIKPGADAGRIKVRIDGADSLAVNDRRYLEVATGLGIVSFTKPLAYQEVDGERHAIEVAYALKGNKYSFEVGEYDKTRELIIDPVLACTFVGGSNTDEAFAMCTGGRGEIYVAGRTYSTDYPTTVGAYAAGNTGNVDVFVSKLDSSLSNLLASTYLGGTSFEEGKAIAVGADDNVYVAGNTASVNFPTTPEALDRVMESGACAFISKFDPDLQQLLASTYLGGSGGENAMAMTLDIDGNICLTGVTHSADFPVTDGAYQTTITVAGSSYVARLDPNLQYVLAATFLGGMYGDQTLAITTDNDRQIYVAGWTQSPDFPTSPDAYDTACGTTPDCNNYQVEAFISKFDSDLQYLLASTYLGGSFADEAYSLALDPYGNIYVGGFTASSDFPVTGEVYDQTCGNGGLCDNYYYDSFVSKFDGNLTSLIASTFLGGNDHDRLSSINLEANGNVYVTGQTMSADFPVTADALDQTLAGYSEAYISVLDTNLSTLPFSTFLGGQSAESACCIISRGNGIVNVAGTTYSPDFPTTEGAYDRIINQNGDVFVAVVDLALADSDGDGIADDEDNCPNAANADQADSDSDSFGDACDNCPSLDNDQTDSDSDGVGDACDNCPAVANPNQEDSDGDGYADACDVCPQLPGRDQTDSDGDGVGDQCDICPNDSNPGQEDLDFLCEENMGDIQCMWVPDGHGEACDNCPGTYNPTQADTDADGVGDLCDNCPFGSNPSQLDQDSDSVGDLCDNCLSVANPSQTNSDSDGLGDACDNCPNRTNPGQEDLDLMCEEYMGQIECSYAPDGSGEACDNCPGAYNPSQSDTDADQIGDLCDNCPNDGNEFQSDSDADSVGDACDNCMNTPNPSQTNSDGDTAGDACDNCPTVTNPTHADADGDSFGDACDNCPTESNFNQFDTDGDTLGDSCDNCPVVSNVSQADNDNDSVGNVCDNCQTVSNADQADYNDDGHGDSCDCADGFMGPGEMGADCGGVVCGGGSEACGQIYQSCNFWPNPPQCYPSPCLPIIYNGSTWAKIDVVFVPDADYNGNMTQFLTDVKNMIETVYFGAPEFADNRCKFNFWYYNSAGVTDSGDYEPTCQKFAVPTPVYTGCSFADQRVIIYNGGGRACTLDGTISARTNGGGLVHETGHGIFGLQDEYCCDSNYKAGPNVYHSQADCMSSSSNPATCAEFCPEERCDWTSLSACQATATNWLFDPSLCVVKTVGGVQQICSPNWRNFQGTGWKECCVDGGDGWWKSDVQCIMESGTAFQPDCHNRIVQKLADMSPCASPSAAATALGLSANAMQSSDEPDQPESPKVIVLHYKIAGDVVTLLDHTIVYNYPPNSFLEHGELAVREMSPEGETLVNIFLEDPTEGRYFDENDEHQIMRLDDVDFTAVMPFVDGVKIVEVLDTETGQTLHVADLSQAILDFCSDGTYLDPQCQVSDLDADGVPDMDDNCPTVTNANQADCDSDGMGDACDSNSNCGTDADGDGIADDADNCVDVPNPGQEDCNSNHVGDACDAVNPLADDSDCDNVDDNCNGVADEQYAAVDTACGVGECAAAGQLTCVGGAVVDTCSPGVPSQEICDGLDNDCDGGIDEGVGATFYRDADGDTYGDATVSILACLAPAGFVPNNADCDDANSSVNPGAAEIPNNGVDDDCNSSTPDEVPLAHILVKAEEFDFGDSWHGVHKQPIVGMPVEVYDEATCPDVMNYGGWGWKCDHRHQYFESIRANCEPVATGVTDAEGKVRIGVYNVPGKHVVIGLYEKEINGELYQLYLAKKVMIDRAGTVEQVKLGVMIFTCRYNHKARVLPLYGTVIFGSELNVFEPEYIVWEEGQTQADIPIVYESPQEWEVDTTLTPPEGYVPDETAKTTYVENAVATAVFEVTEVGSVMDSTEVEHDIRELKDGQVVQRVNLKHAIGTRSHGGPDRFGLPADWHLKKQTESLEIPEVIRLYPVFGVRTPE